MAWSTDTARPLTEAFNGALGAPGTLGLRIGFVPSGQVSGMSLLSPPR